jgi:hypothetical protein
MIPVLSSCRQLFERKGMDERITLRKADKIPYGTYVAFEELKYIFPDAEVSVTKQSPADYNSLVKSYSYNSESKYPKALYVIITPEFRPDERELEALMQFVEAGNHVFVSSFNWGAEFSDSLKFHMAQPGASVPFFEDSLRVDIKNPVTSDSVWYSYPGKTDYTHLESYDSNYSRVMGHDGLRRPNLIRENFRSGGSITIQSDPLALSNFFLLHKSNIGYYNQTFSYFPKSLHTVIWDQYFRYGKDFNSLTVILNNPGFRAAFWLVLLLFALIYLFESKRKQRIIPVVQPLRNTSLDFVTTVGRLYHEYHDNKNLGMKMTAHLMEHIRQNYQLPTTVLDDGFVASLAFKSGYPKETLHELIYKAKMINDFSEVSDEDLMDFHRQIEAFYKYQ